MTKPKTKKPEKSRGPFDRFFPDPWCEFSMIIEAYRRNVTFAVTIIFLFLTIFSAYITITTGNVVPFSIVLAPWGTAFVRMVWEISRRKLS